jgi:hypothetical protein
MAASVGTFDGLDAVPEGILYMAAANLGHLVVPTHGDAGLDEVVNESVQGANYECGVCFARRVEVSVDPHMELHAVSTEPAASTRSECGALEESRTRGCQRRIRERLTHRRLLRLWLVDTALRR